MSSTLNHSYYRARLSPHGRQPTSSWCESLRRTSLAVEWLSMSSDSRRCEGNERKVYKSETNIESPGAYIFSSFPSCSLFISISRWLCVREWLFLWSSSVFFFPSPCCFSLVETSFYPNSFRSPFISYLFIICFTFFAFSMRRPSILKGKEELNVESSRLSFWRWITAVRTILYKIWWKKYKIL